MDWNHDTLIMKYGSILHKLRRFKQLDIIKLNQTKVILQLMNNFNDLSNNKDNIMFNLMNGHDFFAESKEMNFEKNKTSSTSSTHNVNNAFDKKNHNEILAEFNSCILNDLYYCSLLNGLFIYFFRYFVFIELYSFFCLLLTLCCKKKTVKIFLKKKTQSQKS
jgi:hypothetical protein